MKNNNPNNLKFHENFFEDEVRSGFYVPAIMKQLWGAEIELLAELDRVCKKHGISYFADWGTLIGAVRHEGFVPWDDDLDVCMLRADYEKFLRVAPDELEEGFEVYNYENREDHWLFLARFINKNRICFEPEHLDRFHQFPYIVSIDIFVVDYVPEDDVLWQKQRDDFRYVYAVANMLGNDFNEDGSVLAENRHDEQMAKRVLPEIEKRTGQKVFPGLSGLALKRRLFEIAESVLARFGPEDCDEVSQLVPFGLYNKSLRWPASDYAHTIDLSFENTTIPVFMKYDGRLRTKYGDYMIPYKGGGAHDYPYFKEQQEKLSEILDFEVPRYAFDVGQVRDVDAIRQVSDANKNACEIGNNSFAEIQSAEATRSAFSYEEIFGKAQDASEAGTFRAGKSGENSRNEDISEQSLEIGDDTFKDLVTQCLDGLQELHEQLCATDDGNLLTESQQLAVDLGTLIENVHGEGTKTVSLLEQFCENLYQVSVGEMDVLDLERSLGSIKDMAECEILTKKEVLFVITKPEHVPYMQSLMQQAVEMEDVLVTILPVPYYDKKYDGSLHEERFYGDAIREVVENAVGGQIVWTADYTTCDLNLRHPEVIVFDNPCDEWNLSTSIHPNFYSEKLQQACDRLIYIQPFVTDDFSRGDEREYYNAQYFVTMPGVARADVVFVPSEAMRQVYIEKWCDFAGKDTRSIWESKVRVKAECYEVDTEGTSNKKHILFGIHASFLQEASEQGIAKLQRTFETFAERTDGIQVIYCPHSKLQEATEQVSVDLWREYELLLDSYQDAPWLVVEPDVWGNPDRIREFVNLADAYYGTGGSIPLEVAVAKKPVLIMSVEA